MNTEPPGDGGWSFDVALTDPPAPPSTILYQPPPKHRCDVGWSDRKIEFPSSPPDVVVMRGQWDPPGTVRACDVCGRTWKAYPYYHPPGDGWSPRTIWWRREGLLARWWRQRKRR
jgi:hypothetical protein